MSFALSTPDVEWGSRDLGGMFAQPGCLRSPRFMKMWYEIVRFSNNAGEVLDEPDDGKWANATLGEYLKKRGCSDYFAQHYVIPMCAAIWSCSDADALAWPVKSLVRFWKNHHVSRAGFESARLCCPQDLRARLKTCRLDPRCPFIRLPLVLAAQVGGSC